MADTVLLAVGAADETRIEELVETAEGVVDAGGTVHLLHVFDRDEYQRLLSDLGVDPDSETTVDDVAGRHDVSRQIADLLDDRGVEVTIRGALGTEAETIVQTAEEVDADMVLVGGRRRSQTGKLVFGSTAQKVLLEADCPVTFVKARRHSETAAPAPADD